MGSRARNLLFSLIPFSLTFCGCVKKAIKSEDFVNGINIAWVEFGKDIGTGTPPLDSLRDQFHRLATVAQGGTAVARLWLHTDGRLTPQFDQSQTVVTGTGQPTASDLRAILDLARQENVQVLLVLWSHDLLRTSEHTPRQVLERNRKLFTDEAVLASYIDNALTPLVAGVAGHPAIYGWEICNEPEWLTVDENWAEIGEADRIGFSDLLRFVNRQAGAIRRAGGRDVKITLGSMSAKYITRFSDKFLREAGGDKDGYLDFYQIHYYEYMGDQINPFKQSAENFHLDKPILVGEFYMHEWKNFDIKTRREAYLKLRKLGYMGAMAWKDEANPELPFALQAIGYNRDME